MKTKTFTGTQAKLEKIKNFYAHFGWKVEQFENGKLVMSLDKKIKYGYALKKLFKEAKKVRTCIPGKVIAWAIVTAIFLVPYFILKNGGLDLSSILPETIGPIKRQSVIDLIPIVLLVLGGINAMFTIYNAITFAITKITSKKALEEIYKLADALSGNVIDTPFPHCIAEDTQMTGELEKYCSSEK